MFLQETYSTRDIETVWKSEWGGNILYSHGTNHSRGVMILINPKLNIRTDHVTADKNGRYLLLQVAINDTNLYLCNIYSPNNVSEQKTFFSNLLNILINTCSAGEVIIGGDFNCSLTAQDKFGGCAVNRKQNVISEITNLCKCLNLQDVWRRQHPNQQQFTWRDKALKVQCRLDYWLVSAELSSLVLSTDIRNSTLSDHSAIILNLRSKDYVPRGPGFWKFNNSLLNDNIFIDQLENRISEYKRKYCYLEDKGLAWDMIKMEIRGFCVQYCKRKNRERRVAEKELSDQIDTLLKILATHRTKENITKLYCLRSKLDKLAAYKTKGAIIRSRTRWHEQGEKNTKYFLNLEKRQNSKSYISRLILKNDQEITNSDEILAHQKLFYQNLYTAVPTSDEHDNLFFNDPSLTKLNENEQEELELPLTQKECLQTLRQCAKGKCPGSDGLSVEFYLHFWPLLGDKMVESFNYGFKHGHLNITQKQGIIKVVPKKRKNRLYLENWRLISLLNIDYKIAAKTIARRISKLLPKLISEDQTGYIKGRYIGQNIRLIKDILRVSSLEAIPGLAIFIDFKKAFDSVDWNFLSNTLEAFNFGPQLKRWITTFYNGCSSCVINNGHASEFFFLQRGVRQGCPLSGILFTLCAEILANVIRNDDNIHGIKIYGKEFKLSQYADDTTAFVSDTTSAENLFKLLRAFQECSGLEVNTSKTEGMWIGANKGDNSKPLNIAWPLEAIYALGINFSYDGNECFQKNFEEKLKSMKNLLNLWKPRNLTLYGRITILKSLGLSKLVYNTSVLTFPVTFMASVKRTICDFVWNGKPKIKHNTLIGPISKGGLNLPDFEIINNALKVVWIRRLYESKKDANWSHIPLVFIRHLGGPFLFKCNYDLKYLNLNIPIDFYKDTLLIWQTLNQHTPQTKEQILEEIIWNNRFIKIEGLSVYYREWHNAGITRVKDIFNKNKFLAPDVLSNKFSLKSSNFLKYLALCSAIPRDWIRILKDTHETPAPVPDTVNTISINKLSCKIATQILIAKKFQPPTAERRMRQANLDDNAIQTIYNIPFNVTKDIKLAIFQYKVAHHILPTNATLFRDKIKENDKCHLCEQKQTLTHLFVSCPFVKSFWTEFTNWWNTKNDDSIELNEENIIYGFTNNIALQLGLNLSLIIAKYYIYIASREEDPYFFDTFLAVLRSKLDIEKHNSKLQINL